MADETKEATQGSKFYVYYFSDPDGATKDARCHEIFTLVPFETVPWHVHKQAPDASLKDPVWDTKLNNGLGGWRENDATEQGQVLAQAQAKIVELDKKSQELDQKNAEYDQANAKLDSALKTVQQAQVASATQSQMETKQMGQIMQVLQTMQQSMATLAKSVTAQPTAPKQDSQATQASDAKNGGNK